MEAQILKIKHYYDSRYREAGNKAFRPPEAYPVFLSYLGIQARQRILDVGCGSDFLLAVAERMGCRTYGVYLSDYAVDLARKNAPNSEIKMGQAEKLDYPDSFFDYLTCIGTLEHCLDINKALSEMKRVTKEDAKI